MGTPRANAHGAAARPVRAALLFVLLVLLIGTFVIGWRADDIVRAAMNASPVTGAQLTWLVSLAAFAAAVLLIGWVVNRRPFGAFIDSRNRYGLAQVQAILWLVVVSSAVTAIAVSNVRRGSETPLAIGIPAELLAIIGLSVTNAVGTPIIRSVKRANTTPDDTQWKRTHAQLTAKGRVTNPDTEGSLVVYTDPDQTGWTDLVSGEETGNAATVDVGKLQLLYFTAVALFVYGAAIFTKLAGAGADLAFPPLDASFVGILGLSNAGALAYLAAPHARTA
jgi:hypothetical protein